MPSVGPFFVQTYATVQGTYSKVIGSSSIDPKHVIEVKNGTTIPQDVIAYGAVGPGLDFAIPPGSKTWSSVLQTIQPRISHPFEYPISHKPGHTGGEHLFCTKLQSQGAYSSSPTIYDKLSIRARVTVTS